MPEKKQSKMKTRKEHLCHSILTSQLYGYIFSKKTPQSSVGIVNPVSKCSHLLPDFSEISNSIKCNGGGRKCKKLVCSSSLASSTCERALAGVVSSKLHDRQSAVVLEPTVTSISQWTHRSTIQSPWGWSSFLRRVSLFWVLHLGRKFNNLTYPETITS